VNLSCQRRVNRLNAVNQHRGVERRHMYELRLWANLRRCLWRTRAAVLTS
jgi:hypothetical protein